MSTTTKIIRALPSNESGVTLTNPSTSATWSPSPEVVIGRCKSEDIEIVGAIYTFNLIMTADVTYDANYIDILTGSSLSNLTIKTQFPFSERRDSAVGFYCPAMFWLPEPQIVEAYKYIVVRLSKSVNASMTISGVKLLYTSVLPILNKSEIMSLENYKNIKVGTGMSVTERGGSFR